jgi:hypothetical protein
LRSSTSPTLAAVQVALRLSSPGLPVGAGPQVTTQRYDFKRVAVASLAVSASGPSDEQSVSFGYGALSISFTPVTTQGQAGQTVSGGFDLTQNKAV